MHSNPRPKVSSPKTRAATSACRTRARVDRRRRAASLQRNPTPLHQRPPMPTPSLRSRTLSTRSSARNESSPHRPTFRVARISTYFVVVRVLHMSHGRPRSSSSGEPAAAASDKSSKYLDSSTPVNADAERLKSNSFYPKLGRE